MNSRRTLTYFHSGSELIVRAPQTRLLRPSKKRSALMPSGVQHRLPVEGDVLPNRVMPRTTSLAGAFHTPARCLCSAGRIGKRASGICSWASK